MKIELVPNEVVLATDNMEPLNAMEIEIGCSLDEFNTRHNLAFDRRVLDAKKRSEMTFAERIISDCRECAAGIVLRAAYGK